MNLMRNGGINNTQSKPGEVRRLREEQTDVWVYLYGVTDGATLTIECSPDGKHWFNLPVSAPSNETATLTGAGTDIKKKCLYCPGAQTSLFRAKVTNPSVNTDLNADIL